ncbi:unnamed protein product, partial [Nippostrongylus brasiliensis]|uniref:glucuronosyltransferase n=1 Tax=Nippostrongylus brasiliensis TaxID=27835 RepID=A0A0N4YVC6_NIPBR
HPKCRVHVSHGGTNSVIESVWHGVPTIGVPLTVAGHDNLLRISARGAGLLIPKKEFSKSSLVKALKEIRDKKYKEEMLVFQDMVPHARSGADKLNVFQYFLVDVIVFMLSVLLLIFSTIYFIIRTIFRVVKYVIFLPFNQAYSTPKQLKKNISHSKKRN